MMGKYNGTCGDCQFFSGTVYIGKSILNPSENGLIKGWCRQYGWDQTITNKTFCNNGKKIKRR